MGLKIIGQRKLDRVCGDYRQLHARGQLDGGCDMGFIVRTARALQLKVEAVHKQA